MPDCDDHNYFAQRAEEEMVLGDEAASAAIATLHYELAHRYSLIAFFKNHGKLSLVPTEMGKIAA